MSASQPIRHHTLVVLVENKAGVLTRVAGLFARRGFNIYSLAVAPTDDDERFSRITIVVDVALTHRGVVCVLWRTITRVAGPVAVTVSLGGVGRGRTVVARVSESVAVAVELVRVGGVCTIVGDVRHTVTVAV